jgi:hypothetical protein
VTGCDAVKRQVGWGEVAEASLVRPPISRAGATLDHGTWTGWGLSQTAQPDKASILSSGATSPVGIARITGARNEGAYAAILTAGYSYQAGLKFDATIAWAAASSPTSAAAVASPSSSLWSRCSSSGRTRRLCAR